MVDRSDWQQCTPGLIPPKLVTGHRARLTGQLWRRKAGDRWEYRQDPETEDEFADRAW